MDPVPPSTEVRYSVFSEVLQRLEGLLRLRPELLRHTPHAADERHDSSLLARYPHAVLLRKHMLLPLGVLEDGRFVTSMVPIYHASMYDPTTDREVGHLLVVLEASYGYSSLRVDVGERQVVEGDLFASFISAVKRLFYEAYYGRLDHDDVPPSPDVVHLVSSGYLVASIDPYDGALPRTAVAPRRVGLDPAGTASRGIYIL